MNTKALAAIIGVFVGCCSNVVFLELLVKYVYIKINNNINLIFNLYLNFRSDPGSGNLITFLQFLFIAAHGFIFTAKFGTVKPRIGLRDYFILVVMFFFTSVCNNYAYVLAAF